MLGELEDLACQRQRPGIQDKEQDLHQPQHSCPTQVSARICTWEGEGQPGVTPCPLPCTPCHGTSESNNPGFSFLRESLQGISLMGQSPHSPGH